jgi:predicted phage-related endonuclease
MTQLQLYLELMGLDQGSFAVCFGSSELLPFNIVRDPSYTGAVIEALAAWKRAYIDTDSPPPAEGCFPGDVKLYTKLHPNENGERIILDDEGVTAAAQLETTRNKRIALEKEEAGLKTILLGKIGDASYAVMPDGSGYHWQCQTINHAQKDAWTEERRVLIRRKKL